MKYLRKLSAALLALTMLLSAAGAALAVDDTELFTDENGQVFVKSDEFETTGQPEEIETTEQQTDAAVPQSYFVDEEGLLDIQDIPNIQYVDGDAAAVDEETYLKGAFHLIDKKSDTINGHRVLYQNARQYDSIAYGSSTVAQGSCGPSAVCNALYAAGIADVDIPTMCKLAVQCGARYNGGTDVETLMEFVSKKYNFSYKIATNKADLKAHLKAGGIAIVHAGNSYSLFTYYGHFMAADGIDENDNVSVLDSYWYPTKFNETAARKNNVTVVKDSKTGKTGGVLSVKLDQVAKACNDRKDRYYLIEQGAKSAKQNGDAPFTDVMDNKWYYDEVVNTYNEGLMSGVGGSSFNPTGILSRAQAAQILYNYEVKKNGKPQVGEVETFTDVAEGKWYTDAIKWARSVGVISGVGNNKFAPDQKLTRQEFAAIMFRYSKMAESTTDSLSSFSDYGKVAKWAKSGMNWAVQNGIITGTGSNKLSPTGSAERSQAAAIILRYKKLIENA